MRLSDEATLVAAQEAGITVFDTARAYGENEALLARVLRGAEVRIVTKGGMRREDVFHRRSKGRVRRGRDGPALLQMRTQPRFFNTRPMVE